MRVVILGAGDRHKTEASLQRACRQLGHPARLIDVAGWTRKLGPLARPWIQRRVEAFAPDRLILSVPAAQLGERLIRALCARYRSSFWYFDFTHPPATKALMLARAAGTMFVTYAQLVEVYRSLGIPRVHFLPQGVDPELDRPPSRIPKSWHCEVSFVGSGHYPHRHQVLRAIASAYRLQIRGPGWQQAPRDLPVVGGPVWGRKFAQVVGGAAISLGASAVPEQDRQRASASNRMWKVMGCGGFYLGQYVEHIDHFARGGEHCAWYHDPQDAVESIHAYLRDPDARVRIARAGRAHALAHHTYAHRLELLLREQGYTSW